MRQRVAPEAAAPGIVNAPVISAADTVVFGAIGLDAGKTALRAGATCMQPLAVGVEHILDIVLARSDAVLWAEHVVHVIPSFALDTNQVKIAVEIAVPESRVGYLVEEGETVLGRFYRGEMNCRGRGRPEKVVTLFEIDSREISLQFSDE